MKRSRKVTEADRYLLTWRNNGARIEWELVDWGEPFGWQGSSHGPGALIAEGKSRTVERMRDKARAALGDELVALREAEEPEHHEPGGSI